MLYGGGDFFAQGNQRDSDASRDGRVGVNHNVTLSGCNGPSRCVEGGRATCVGSDCASYWWKLKDPLCCSILRGVRALRNIDLTHGFEMRYGYEAAFV